jgi:homoserine dehydrogenase
MKQQVRIGLLGVGTVGQAVARSLVERQDVLSRAAGTPLVLQRAAVRDLARPRSLAVDRLTADPAAVASADDVDLVIELVGGEEPARTLIASALERGRPVVTANKRVLAWHGPMLAELAARKGVELRYEAAVGGGIPLIAPLTDDLAANRVLELRAIINGAWRMRWRRRSRPGTRRPIPATTSTRWTRATSSASCSGWRSASPAPQRSFIGKASAASIPAISLMAGSSATC